LPDSLPINRAGDIGQSARFVRRPPGNRPDDDRGRRAQRWL